MSSALELIYCVGHVAVITKKALGASGTFLGMCSFMDGPIAAKPLARSGGNASELLFASVKWARRAPNRADGVPRPGGASGGGATASPDDMRDFLGDEAFDQVQQDPAPAPGPAASQ